MKEGIWIELKVIRDQEVTDTCVVADLGAWLGRVGGTESGVHDQISSSW